MSELITARLRTDLRFQLLATASALALLTVAATETSAEEGTRPTVWIEGGWQFESVTGANDIVTPPLDGLTTSGFSSTPTTSNFLGQGSGGFPSFTEMEKALGRSGGAEGSISFQPKGSDWVFSVSGRYGRTHTRKRQDQRQDIEGEVARTVNLTGVHQATPHYTNYVVQAADTTEAHTILDFQVGRDIGVGLLGGKTESVFSFGARYAQMNVTSKGHSYAAPGVRFYGHAGNSLGKYIYTIQRYHQNSATLIERYSNFRGIGPSVSWSNTTGLLGDVSGGQLALDWGANAALLFGRQNVKVNVSTLYNAVPQTAVGPHNTEGSTIHRTQSRHVTVPNLGGFAALSYRFTNAKISAGYRADFFFGALDRGLATHNSVTTGFNGPYATIAIGLGG